jgi:hypothetical protein
MLLLMLEFNKFLATKSEDVVLTVLLMLMVEILDPLMEALELAQFLLTFLLIFPMVLILYNGLGLEELSL